MADHSRAGQAFALSVLTPVLPGREQALRTLLEGLPHGPDSPLAAVPGTHFARWVLVPQLVQQGPPMQPDLLRGTHLLFTSNLDGEPGPYLHALATRVPDVADAVWGHCLGYPGSADPAAFVAWVEHHRLPTAFFVSGYPDAPLPRVLAALSLRDRVTRFAVDAQGLPPDELLAAFRAAFPESVPAAVPEQHVPGPAPVRSPAGGR